MPKWCHSCLAEYVDNWSACANCGRPLRSEPPPSAPIVEVSDPAFFTDPPSRRNYSDPWIRIWTGPAPEGGTLVRTLEDEAIPFDTDSALEPGHLTLLVPRSYAPDASAVVAAGTRRISEGLPSAPDDASELFEHSRPQIRLRLLLAAVALLLIIVLLMTS